MKVCRFNADKHPDLLVTNFFSNTTTVILSSMDKPTDQWEQHTYAVPGFPMFSACGAFAGKDVDDFATSITQWSQQASPPNDTYLNLPADAANPAAGQVFVQYNDGMGLVTQSKEFPTGLGQGLQLAAGHLDGDDYLDLVIASSTGDIQFLKGAQGGAFELPSALEQPLDQRAYGLALADFNGDGLLDIVTADTPPLTISELSEGFFFAKRGGANVIINTCWADANPTID